MVHHWFLTRKIFNRGYHFIVGFPLILLTLGFGVINDVLSGNAIQTIDALIPSIQAFFQKCAWSKESITFLLRWRIRMKLHSWFSNPVLNVKFASSLPFFGGTFLLVLVFLEFLIVFFQLSSQGFRKVASSPSFNQSNSVLHLTLVGCLPFFILLKKVSNCYR